MAQFMESQRIMIAEDEDALRHNLERFLGELGHRVRSVACGKDAVRLLQHEKFDIVITDIRLGDMNGLDLVSQITSRSSLTAVLVMTADNSADSIVDALRMGAYDYLFKPFSLEALGRTVERVASQRQTVLQNLALRRKIQDHHDT